MSLRLRDVWEKSLTMERQQMTLLPTDIASLRRMFLERLPETIADLAGDWRCMRQSGTTESQCQELAKRVAVLAGSAATFRCDAVADIAHRFEALLRRAERAGGSLFVRQGDAYVDWLATAAVEEAAVSHELEIADRRAMRDGA